MPISLSTQALIEKNKRISDNPFLILLEIQHQELTTPLYLCNNNEDTVFNGKTWKAVVFELDDINETKEAEIPELNLSIIDLTRELITELDSFDGGVGASVYIRVINLGVPNEYLREELFNINSVDVSSSYKVTFKLGVNKLNAYRSPKNRYLKTHCRYKEFKGDYCGYSGTEEDCNRTFVRCKQLGNQKRFGGFPGIGVTGIFK